MLLINLCNLLVVYHDDIVQSLGFCLGVISLSSAEYEVKVLCHCQADQHEFCHEHNPVLKADFASHMGVRVVIEIAGVIEDPQHEEDPQSQKKSTQDKVEDSSNALIGASVVVQLMEKQSDSHQDYKSELKVVGVLVAARIFPVKSQLESHYGVYVGKNNSRSVQNEGHLQLL